MRTYHLGIDEEIKVYVLDLFQDPGDRLSVGNIYERVTEKYDITPGRFFRFLSDLEKLRYIAHETVVEGKWTISVLRRL